MKKNRPIGQALAAAALFGMIVLDIAAPICLMIGLQHENPATASLLNNFEIVATAFIALCLFREQVGKRMWLAIGLITLASILLSMEHEHPHKPDMHHRHRHAN